jgi:hypothetical protein
MLPIYDCQNRNLTAKFLLSPTTTPTTNKEFVETVFTLTLKQIEAVPNK